MLEPSAVSPDGELDEALVRQLADSHELLVTVEENSIMGGAGSAVAEFLAGQAIVKPLLQLGLPDAFQRHASREDLLAEAGLDEAGIRASILARWPDLLSTPTRAIAGG